MRSAFVETPHAFTEAETRRVVTVLRRLEQGNAAGVVEGQTFTPIGHEAADVVGRETLRWLTGKMLDLARTADEAGGWGFGPDLEPSDEMIYNRFGRQFSDTTFDWHCDDDDGGPRDISVVAYFTDSSDFAGGDLEMFVPTDDGTTPTNAEQVEHPKSCNPEYIVRRRFSAGDAIAFPSKGLKHRVTAVTDGQRRSLLLLCRRRSQGTIPHIFPPSDWQV